MSYIEGTYLEEITIPPEPEWFKEAKREFGDTLTVPGF